MKRLGAAGCLLAACAALAGCGSSNASKTASVHSGKHTTSTVAKVTKPIASPYPELVVCDFDVLYGIPVRSSGDVATPLAQGPSGTFAYRNESNINGPVGTCQDTNGNNNPDPSPDLTKFAETKQVSDGSDVAGYVRAGASNFVEASQATSGYAAVPVEDQSVQFSGSGSLWWIDTRNAANGKVLFWEARPSSSSRAQLETPVLVETLDDWDADLDGGISGQNATMEGDQGPTASLLPAGALVAEPSLSGADERTAALLIPDGFSPEDCTSQSDNVVPEGECPGVWVGTPAALSSQCVWTAVDKALAFDKPSTCPGVVELPSPPCSPVGLAASHELVCIKDDTPEGYQTTIGSTSQYLAVPFSLFDKSWGKAVPLTPKTDQAVTTLGVSPDGRTLWFDASDDANAAASDPPNSLYEVPTSGYAAAPTSYRATIRQPLPARMSETEVEGDPDVLATVSAADVDPIGWWWHGRFTPLPALLTSNDNG